MLGNTWQMLALNTSDKTSILSIIMQIHKLRSLDNFNINTNKVLFSSSTDKCIYCDFCMSQKNGLEKNYSITITHKKGKNTAVVILNIPGFRI